MRSSKEQYEINSTKGNDMNSLNMYKRHNTILMCMVVLLTLAVTCMLLYKPEAPPPEIEYVEVVKEVPVVEYVEVQKKYYSVTTYERDVLAKVVFLESGGESVECQKAVCSVIMNRVQRGYGSIESICHDSNQFSVAPNVDRVEPPQRIYDAVDEVIQNGSTIPDDIVYFRGYRYHSWAPKWKKIGNLYFSRIEK